MSNLTAPTLVVNLRRWIRAFATATTLLSSGLAFSAGATGYLVIDLGPSSPTLSNVTGINAHGQVIGNLVFNGGPTGVYLSGAWSYRNGVWGPGPIAVGDVPIVEALDINDTGYNNNGDIVGDFSNGNCKSRNCVEAFLLDGLGLVDFGTMGGQTSTANAVNASQQVVGSYQTMSASGAPIVHAWLYTNATGAVTTLGTLGGASSNALGINAAGTVVGVSETSGGENHAFVYTNGVMTDLGTLGGASSAANRINANGQVVGDSTTSSGDTHAFLTACVNCSLTDLGTLGGSYSTALRINVNGQVVGESTTSDGQYDFFVYSDGAMTDLNSFLDPSSGLQIASVGGINDAGQIAALGCAPPIQPGVPKTGCQVLLLSPLTTVVEYQNTQDFQGSPGGHFFYTDNPGEQALVDSGVEGHFVRTGRTFNSGGPKPLCRFYGSVVPGPNSHFYTIYDGECYGLISLQIVPTPLDMQQWNYEGVAFKETPILGFDSCPTGTIPVYRAYNNAYPPSGPKNPWDSAHRFSTNHADILNLVTYFGWADEGPVFCSLP